MSFTLIGLINLAFSDNLYWILASVFLIGIGSSVLHPEASRIHVPCLRRKRGLATNPLFQVGGNFGGSLGPLLVASVGGSLWQATSHRICICGFSCYRSDVPNLQMV